MFLSFFSVSLSSAITCTVYLFFFGSVFFSSSVISPTRCGCFVLPSYVEVVALAPQLQRLELAAIGRDQAALHAEIALHRFQVGDGLLQLGLGLRGLALHIADLGRDVRDLGVGLGGDLLTSLFPC